MSDPKFGSYYTFDDASQDEQQAQEERPQLKNRLGRFLRSRYALLAIAFLLAGVMIFYNTAALQLTGVSAAPVSETSGVSRQQVIPANRGDIVDAAGIPLAYSRSVNVLYLTYASLPDQQLNAMLLDLAEFLQAHNVTFEPELADYFQLDHSACSHAEGDGDDCGLPIFMKDDKEITYWQTDSNIYALKQPKAGQAESALNDSVKLNPDLFFDWLRYEYAIEDPEADGQMYTKTEAMQIINLRYLLTKNNWTFINGRPIELVRGIPDEVVSIITEQNYRFRGVMTGLDSERVYTDDARHLSHVIGYTGRISASQYEELKSLGYAPDAITGQAGVEASAERYLAGRSGTKPYNIWSIAGEEGTFFSELSGSDPIPGANVRLTIDLNLQKTANRVLEEVIEEIRSSPRNANLGDADAGAVVMLDVRTGKILAMASYPSYNPSDFIDQATDEEARARVVDYLTNNQQKAMWNRTMMEIYAPGSTFKPVTAIAGLETGAITPNNNVINDPGRITIDNWPFRCLEYPSRGHGNLTLKRAMATSCNVYFYQLGVRTGIDSIDKYGKMLGLGERTGIDLPGEAKGYRSSRETKKLLRANPVDQTWFPADTAQSAIGQFDNSFSILQLARFTASLATGNLVTPYVIDSVTRNDGTIVQADHQEPEPIDLKESTLQAVRESMIAVAHDKEGTAYSYFKDYPVKVAAKTGTAETGFEDVSSSNGLFIAYAPADNPEVAIAQIVEKGAWGSNTIGITKALLDEYFGFGVKTDHDLVILPGVN